MANLGSTENDDTIITAPRRVHISDTTGDTNLFERAAPEAIANLAHLNVTCASDISVGDLINATEINGVLKTKTPTSGFPEYFALASGSTNDVIPVGTESPFRHDDLRPATWHESKDSIIYWDTTNKRFSLDSSEGYRIGFIGAVSSVLFDTDTLTDVMNDSANENNIINTQALYTGIRNRTVTQPVLSTSIASTLELQDLASSDGESNEAVAHSTRVIQDGDMISIINPGNSKCNLTVSINGSRAGRLKNANGGNVVSGNHSLSLGADGAGNAVKLKAVRPGGGVASYWQIVSDNDGIQQASVYLTPAKGLASMIQKAAYDAVMDSCDGCAVAQFKVFKIGSIDSDSSLTDIKNQCTDANQVPGWKQTISTTAPFHLPRLRQYIFEATFAIENIGSAITRWTNYVEGLEGDNKIFVEVRQSSADDSWTPASGAAVIFNFQKSSSNMSTEAGKTYTKTGHTIAPAAKVVYKVWFIHLTQPSTGDNNPSITVVVNDSSDDELDSLAPLSAYLQTGGDLRVLRTSKRLDEYISELID